MNSETIYREEVKKALEPLVEIETLKAKDYLTPIEVQRLYPLPVSTLEKMRKDGKGPRYIKRGKNVYYTPTDVRAYLDARRQMTSEH